MRSFFADSIYNLMSGNSKIYVVSGDLGYGMWDKVRDNFPKRFINVGVAEQALIGIAIGLALEGKVPIAYSISSFLLFRPFEAIRNYIHHEMIPVKLIGSGRDKDYRHDGFSHWVEEDKKIMRIFNNIKAKWPKNNQEIAGFIDEMLTDNKPWYINLKKK